MGRYVIRRLLQMIPVFIGTTLLIFLMVYALGDPVTAMFGDRKPDPAIAAQIRADLGLDKPVLVQYWNYMVDITIHRDFGEAFNGQPVTELMSTAFPITLKLTLVAITIQTVIGVALGLFSGLRPGRFVDNGALAFTLLIISIPTFVSGYVLQYLLGVKSDIIEPSIQSDSIGQLLIPGLVVAGVSLAYVTRLTRTTVSENMKTDYLRTAVAKGLPRRRVVGVHLMRNSLIPVVTWIGADIGSLMAGAIVTERIFNIRGVGFELYNGLLRQNSPTVVGFVTILVIVFLLANLLVDILYAVLDPRIRYA